MDLLDSFKSAATNLYGQITTKVSTIGSTGTTAATPQQTVAAEQVAASRQTGTAPPRDVTAGTSAGSSPAGGLPPAVLYGGLAVVGLLVVVLVMRRK